MVGYFSHLRKVDIAIIFAIVMSMTISSVISESLSIAVCGLIIVAIAAYCKFSVNDHGILLNKKYAEYYDMSKIKRESWASLSLTGIIILIIAVISIENNSGIWIYLALSVAIVSMLAHVFVWRSKRYLTDPNVRPRKYLR